MNASANEDERACRDVVFREEFGGGINGIILVADAKNLKRSLAIALQYSAFGLPMMLNINMMDEAVSRGIEIDVAKLSKITKVRKGTLVMPAIKMTGTPATCVSFPIIKVFLGCDSNNRSITLDLCEVNLVNCRYLFSNFLPPHLPIQ